MLGAALSLTALPSAAHADETFSTPAPGTPQRRALMNALRPIDLDVSSDFDGLDIWPAKYPVIPKLMFYAVGMATNAEV